ncbi:MAG TPA: iron-sulfur cluster repair di-iron protein [Blastocatellia bacterium]|nr:iron-sulfur cluster repair di-iron protein [Blastocatellia bacterium]
MTIQAIKTVREIAVELPAATRLFEKLGIDYCCGGARPLAEACATAGLAVDEVVASLEQITAVKEAEARDWRAASLSDLIAHINGTHHVFTREEFDRVEPLLAKVSRVYGERRPELPRIQALFLELKRELLPHLMKEEQVLFPYVRQLELAAAGQSARPASYFGTVQNPVRMMMTEHEAAGDILRRLRELSNDFTPPEDACVTYQTLYRALEAFEQDLHQHIHLENNILFPRAIEME